MKKNPAPKDANAKLPPEKKRQVILRTATETFAREGFKSTDVQKIADRSHLGKGTVYRYFGNKENLFWECGIEIFRQIEAILARQLALDIGPIEKLERFILESGVFFEKNPLYNFIIMQVRFAPAHKIPEKTERYLRHTFFAPISQLFEEAIALGLIPPESPEKYNVSVMDALWGVSAFYRAEEDPLPLPERLRFTFRLLLNGLLVKSR